MAQPTTEQLQAIRDKALAALLKGEDVDTATLVQAAGCVIKLAGDDEDNELLKLFILAGTGNYERAAALLMRLAITDGGADDDEEDDEPDVLTGILTGPAATSAPKPKPQPKAKPAAATATTNNGPEQQAPAAPAARTRTGRRAQR